MTVFRLSNSSKNRSAPVAQKGREGSAPRRFPPGNASITGLCGVVHGGHAGNSHVLAGAATARAASVTHKAQRRYSSCERLQKHCLARPSLSIGRQRSGDDGGAQEVSQGEQLPLNETLCRQRMRLDHGRGGGGGRGGGA